MGRGSLIGRIQQSHDHVLGQLAGFELPDAVPCVDGGQGFIGKGIHVRILFCRCAAWIDFGMAPAHKRWPGTLP